MLTLVHASSTDAADYELNGKCVDQMETFGEAFAAAVGAGFALVGGALVPTPPRATLGPIEVGCLIKHIKTWMEVKCLVETLP